MMNIKPYGDTLDDGMVQVSFTLPMDDSDRVCETAKRIAKKMGLSEPLIAYHTSFGKGFSFFVVYGSLNFAIDLESVQITEKNTVNMDMDEVNKLIETNIGRKIVVVGASTGTDAHTVGIDAIMNMKGFAGHYGLERYQMIEAYNLGSQVSNEDFVKKAIKLNADVLLVSQTVTQKNVHIKNMAELVDLLEAEGIRRKVVLICGGPRITDELAKELGYDAGFGPGKYAEDVAAFAVSEMIARKAAL